MRFRRSLCAAVVAAVAPLASPRAGAATLLVTAAGRNVAEPEGASGFPLDADFDATPPGELYFRLHTFDFGNGELRGQLQPIGGTTDASNGTAIPLPPVLLSGLIGLGTAGWAARRRRN